MNSCPVSAVMQVTYSNASFVIRRRQEEADRIRKEREAEERKQKAAEAAAIKAAKEAERAAYIASLPKPLLEIDHSTTFYNQDKHPCCKNMSRSMRHLWVEPAEHPADSEALPATAEELQESAQESTQQSTQQEAVLQDRPSESCRTDHASTEDQSQPQLQSAVEIRADTGSSNNSFSRPAGNLAALSNSGDSFSMPLEQLRKSSTSSSKSAAALQRLRINSKTMDQFVSPAEAAC